jgi:RHH-type proline utilization regulon transcriptional repressor/proline dehydrogenase/delta 1-pyrroline-5-carboxylate dehydrogenase
MSADIQKKLTTQIEGLLADFKPNPASPQNARIQRSLYVARLLQQRAAELQTPQERRQQTELDRMIQNPGDKATLTQMTDQAFRASQPNRAVDQLTHILDVQGIPRFFNPIDRALLRGFQSFGSYLPGVAVPLVKDKMQRETANVILPAEQDLLAQHLVERRDEGVRMNVNFLGEALLGEDDAQRRLQTYLQSLQLNEIEVISVKISTLYSQITPLARLETIKTLCNRMELLYRAAAKSKFTRSDGEVVSKFVYMDMEEYRDMSITASVFMETLDRPGLKDVAAGIVLQAYIPDSHKTQIEINNWAKKRAAEGGGLITIRIVKGANMEMERFESSLLGLPQPPFRNKIETDANYKRMLHEGVQAENIAAVRLGVASHNLFDLAYAYVTAFELGLLDRIQFEMLEGMANHQRRALFEVSDNLLLYAPACKQTDFIHAIGYLIRRLDENTGPENFLRHAFRIEVDSPEWDELAQGFVESFDYIDKLSSGPRRLQNRFDPAPEAPPSQPSWQELNNEPDTDFALHANWQWTQSIYEHWKDRHSEQANEVPLVVNGRKIMKSKLRESTDPSNPQKVVTRYSIADESDLRAALQTAKEDPDQWRKTTASERRIIFQKVAQNLRQRRGDLLGVALAEGGKILTESDPEVSEAIDFVEFYSLSAEWFESLPNLETTPKGTVAVVSPWNFPIAIPCGGIAAALAAGNTVILKPASDTVLTAYIMCQCFWQAGVSQNTLQFLPCPGSTIGEQLVTADEVDVVILTGGTETAQRMLSAKPTMNLLAETGGKNATIVTALSDRDQAIKHVVQSAFGHCGQKCSATSLLILEEEVYDDENFKKTLCDAVKSLTVGSAWEPTTKIGPLIRPPSGDLEQALKELEKGESWAVLPRPDKSNPHIYSPAVKWGVQPGSKTHLTEFFGPVLGVMKAKNLQHAIDLVHQTGFGLTSGLQSLDDREQQLWRDQLRAGNLYQNRGTTGAIVLRQPFGGMGKSAFGPGIKAGGPNYVAQFLDFRQTSSANFDTTLENQFLDDIRIQLTCLFDAPDSEIDHENLQELLTAIASYDRAACDEFTKEHDHVRLIGQDNIRRYLPISHVRIRICKGDSMLPIFASACAAKAAGCGITVSSCPELDHPAVKRLEQMTESWAAAIEFVEETDEQLARVILDSQTDRIRYLSRDSIPIAIRQAAANSFVFIADAPVICEGRIELLWYVLEQSMSIDYHRYGNLGTRGNEERSPTQ